MSRRTISYQIGGLFSACLPVPPFSHFSVPQETDFCELLPWPITIHCYSHPSHSPYLDAFLATLLYSRSSWSIMASGLERELFLIGSLDPGHTSVNSLLNSFQLYPVCHLFPMETLTDTVHQQKKQKRFWTSSSLKSLEPRVLRFLWVKYTVGT